MVDFEGSVFLLQVVVLVLLFGDVVNFGGMQCVGVCIVIGLVIYEGVVVVVQFIVYVLVFGLVYDFVGIVFIMQVFVFVFVLGSTGFVIQVVVVQSGQWMFVAGVVVSFGLVLLLMLFFQQVIVLCCDIQFLRIFISVFKDVQDWFLVVQKIFDK